MDEENPSLSSHLGSEGHQCDTVSGSSCKKDPGLWVVSTFPLTLALLRVLEMHSKGYLFASCLKLSNNLLIKEDWKHSTSDLAIWGLHGPCCPRTALRCPSCARPALCLLRDWALNHRPAVEAFGLLWAKVTSQKRRSVFQRLSCQMPFQLACRDGHTVHRHCLSTCWVRALCSSGLLVCVPLRPESCGAQSTAPPADYRRRKGKPVMRLLLPDERKGRECPQPFISAQV